MISQKVILILCCGILCLGQIAFVKCDCTLKYPYDIEVSPIYKKLYGKYEMELPYNGKNIQLRDGEYILGECRTNFRTISFTTKKPHHYYYDEFETYTEVLQNLNSIRLQCLNNQLFFNNKTLLDTALECQKLKWSIYDAKEPYEWCEKNLDGQTFLLAAKSNQDYILAGICFNLKKFTLKTITYNVTDLWKNYNIERKRDIKSELKSVQSLGEDLWNLKNTQDYVLTEIDIQRQLIDLSTTNYWLHLANYEISSIVQGYTYPEYFREYDIILNTLWWRNLRLGNWRHFMNTLENYAYNNSFQLYTGTSGVVKVPTENMKYFEELEFKNGFYNKTVPAYIWTYLTSTDHLNEDFIIVAYNSPYAEFFNDSEIIFCPNICSEIPWLKERQKSFNIAVAGIMFCCKPEFMEKTEIRLQGFPMELLKSRTMLKNSNNLEIEGTTSISFGDSNGEENTAGAGKTEFMKPTETRLQDSSMELLKSRVVLELSNNLEIDGTTAISFADSNDEETTETNDIDDLDDVAEFDD